MSTIKKNRSDFKFVKIIGEGSFSTVYLATEINTDNQYAVKELSKQQMVREKKQKYVFRERDVLRMTNHPLIIKLHFTLQDNESLYYGLGYAPNGEILDHLKRLGKFDLNVARFYIAEIITALQYLHSINVIHRDMKPENILLSGDMHILVTDFGSSRILNQEDLEHINPDTSQQQQLPPITSTSHMCVDTHETHHNNSVANHTTNNIINNNSISCNGNVQHFKYSSNNIPVTTTNPTLGSTDNNTNLNIIPNNNDNIYNNNHNKNISDDEKSSNNLNNIDNKNTLNNKNSTSDYKSPHHDNLLKSTSLSSTTTNIKSNNNISLITTNNPSNTSTTHSLISNTTTLSTLPSIAATSNTTPLSTTNNTVSCTVSVTTNTSTTTSTLNVSSEITTTTTTPSTTTATKPTSAISTTATSTTTKPTTTKPTTTKPTTTKPTTTKPTTTKPTTTKPTTTKPTTNPRKHSFVGTAQYVSPEVLNSSFSCFCSDLWAVGCILYQFLTGEHPFRGGNEYLLFQKILSLNYKLPQDIDPSASDIIQQLLVLEWRERLGSTETGGYPALKRHPFFHTIQWEQLIHQTSPLIRLTSSSVCDSGDPIHKTLDSFEDISLPNETHLQELLQRQASDNIYHPFVDNHLILKQGFMYKKKGLIPRRRMFLMTEGPRLLYVDADKMVLKGEVPWTKELNAEAKNFHTIYLHTPNRIYYLEEPEGRALFWCEALNKLTLKYFTSDS